MSRLIKSSLMTLLVLVAPFCICAGESNGISKDVKHMARLERVLNPNRKKSPSRDFIECEYTGTGIMLYPTNQSEVAEVTVTGGDDLTNITEVVSEENGYFVETGILSGVYEIQYHSESGIVYSGWIEI